MRYRSLAPPLAGLMSLALASVALAGGWAQVTVQGGPVDPVAGEATNIELNVLQHGVTPVSWPPLTVVATDASGAVVRAEAQAKGAEGSYVATLVFPSAGEWTLTFDSTELEMAGSIAISVAPAAAAAGPATVASAAAPAFDPVPLVVLLFAAAVALAMGGAMLRSRRASAGTRVSART